MKPKHQRLSFVLFSVIFLGVAVLFTLQAFKDNIVFFYSPTDIQKKTPAFGRVLRLGGLVKAGSLKRLDGQKIQFVVTDGNAEMTIDYEGMLPNLFREGQGIVSQGAMVDLSHFKATSILAKHDENYMPREIVDSLKKNGRWKGDGNNTP